MDNKVKYLVWGLLGAAAAMFIAAIAMDPHVRFGTVQAAPNDVVIDNCQYPGRYYPDGSCDNSDPCDPTTLKDPVLQGRCKDDPAVQTAPVTQEPVKPAEPATLPATGGCGK